MEEKIINMNQFLGAAQGDQEHMLGKFLYFSLANLLVDKDELSSLCESMGIPYTGSTRLSLGDAFRSATGDIRERVPVTVDGETNIYLAYCRDNKRTAGIFSRELVKETLNRETNRYEKLANISCGKNDGMFRCDNLVLDDAVDVQGCCRKAEELFELYQRCANRKQIETICVNFLRGMEATKLSVTGHMYFVPRTFMERVDIFEDFITLLSGLNKKQTPLVVNSFYIIDDAKQRDKMTEEFYLAVKKEIAAYQEKCDYLIKSSSQSPAVICVRNISSQRLIATLPLYSCWMVSMRSRPQRCKSDALGISLTFQTRNTRRQPLYSAIVIRWIPTWICWNMKTVLTLTRLID